MNKPIGSSMATNLTFFSLAPESINDGAVENPAVEPPKRTSKVAKLLDDITGFIFLGAFLVSKAQHIPHPFVRAVTKLISLSAYLVGYFLWFIATFFYEKHERVRDNWYGFAEFKEQFRATSIIGLVATVICLAYPVLLIPASCLFAISNVLWLVGVHHQNNTPSFDITVPKSEKNSYFQYVSLITASSVITATGMVAVFLFPLVAAPILTATTVVSLSLTLSAMLLLARIRFFSQPPKEQESIVPNESFANIGSGLSNSNRPVQEQDEKPEAILEQKGETLYSPNSSDTLDLTRINNDSSSPSFRYN